MVDTKWNQDQSDKKQRWQHKENQYTGVGIVDYAKKLEEVSQNQSHAGTGRQHHAQAANQIVAEIDYGTQGVR